jgi:hypothetical protein
MRKSTSAIHKKFEAFHGYHVQFLGHKGNVNYTERTGWRFSYVEDVNDFDIPVRHISISASDIKDLIILGKVGA